MQRSAITLALLLAVLLIGCGDADTPSASSPEAATPEATLTTDVPASPTIESDASPTDAETSSDLAGTHWALSALNGRILDIAFESTLAFTGEQAGGNTGCNEYGGAYSATDTGNFAMPEIERTEQGCAEPNVGFETEFFIALAEATSYAVVDDQLMLSNADGAETLIFTRDATPELTDTAWNVIVIDGRQVIEGTTVTLAFSADVVSGSSGCNQFGGPYEAGPDGTLVIGDVLQTLIGCTEPAGIGEQERALLTGLAEVTTYAFEDDSAWFPERNRIQLADATGKVRIVLSNEAEPTGTTLLEGTDWVLKSIHDQQPTGVCPTTLSLGRSQYDGEHECVIYVGSISTTADGRITELRKWGDEDKLSDYEAALLSAVEYRADGSELSLIDSSGTVVLRYRPAETTIEGLTDTDWNLVMLNSKPRVPKSVVTLQITENGLGGQSGCNSYGSSFIVAEPGTISIPGGAMTLAGCVEQKIQRQEEAFIETLFQEVVGYRIGETTLELLNAEDEPVLIFNSGPPTEYDLNDTT